MPPRSHDPERKRQELVESAASAFAERGFRRTTIDDIAQRAGVAKGTVYLYFKDKEDLFYATFEWFNQQSMAYAGPAMAAAGDTASRLRALAESAARFMVENRQWYPLTLEVWSAAGSQDARQRFADAMRELYDEYRQATAAIIAGGQSSGELRADLDPVALGAMLTGAIDGLLLQCWFEPTLDPMPLIDGLLDPLLRGMRTAN
jgi:AcrR family transcriptional regulator